MTELETVVREIPYSGKCYIVVKRYDAADFSDTLASQLERARALGAREIYAGFSDAAFMRRKSFSVAGVAFRHYCDFDILIKRLVPEEGPVFRMKRVNEDNAPLYAALHNEAFASVPNAATIDALALARVMSGPYEAGFFMLGGEPMGVYELDFSNAVPEIAAVAIRPELQGAGRGTQAMRSLERRLLSLGHSEARLLVAGTNERAYALYKARGFRRAQRMSRWFMLRLGREGG